MVAERWKCWITCVMVISLAGVFSAADSLAQDRYPARQITILIGTAAGGGQDVMTRILANQLRQVIGQQVIVENRTGANGVIAAGLLVKAKPDGHTLIVNGAQWNALTYQFYKPLPFDPNKELIAVAGIAAGPNVLVVGPTLPVSSIEELVGYAKKHPGKLSFASSGVGSGQHLAGEFFNYLADTNILHVPFKGSAEYLSQVSNGQVAMAMASIIGTGPMIAAGKLKALAVTTAGRVDSLPNVPAVSEFKPLAEFRHVNWVLLFGHASTPTPVVEAINKAVGAALADPTVAKAMRERGNDPAVMTAAEVQDLVNKEGARVIKLIASRNIQIER